MPLLPCAIATRQLVAALLAECERGLVGIVVIPAAVAYKVVGHWLKIVALYILRKKRAMRFEARFVDFG